ncbi:MAG: DUF1775 domain-containing protein [Miltoncostaeaceae bacterium]
MIPRSARRTAAIGGALALALAAAGTAQAHIGVSPGTAVLRESTEFTIRVPTEGGVATNRVRVTFPAQVTVYAVADAPGWTTQILRRPDGRLRGVEWTGGAIPPDQYADFTVLGTPFEEGTSVWKSEQGLANGTVKAWTAAPEAEGQEAPETGPGTPGPAAAVMISAEPAEAGGGGGGGSGTLWAAMIGIALGALARVGGGMVWASRPAELPPDGPDDDPGR